MSSEGAPESWDQDVSNNLQKLNVNASAFVPNVNATEFVPSWGTPSPKPVQNVENSAQPSKKYILLSPIAHSIVGTLGPRQKLEEYFDILMSLVTQPRGAQGLLSSLKQQNSPPTQ